METLQVIRDSVTVIERRDAKAGGPETIRFSNWRNHEDRENENTVVFVTPCPGNVGRHENCGVPPHSYGYEIALPD